MADPANKTVEGQETQDENLESQEQNQEQEKAEETESEKPEGEETGQSEPQEEYWDTEEDYNESIGLGRRTNVQVAEYLQQVEAKAEAYRQTNPTWNPQPQTQQKETPKEGDFKFLPNRGLAAKQLEAMQFPATQTDPDGRIAKSAWSQVAKMFDSALDPTFDKLEENMQSMRFAVAQIADHLQRQSYKNVKRKDLAPFEKIEPFMKQNFILDAEKAVQRYLVDNNPDLLVQLAKDAERTGEKKGQQFKFKKASALRRSKPTQTASEIWKPYATKYSEQTGELDRDKLGLLPTQKQHEVATAFVKYLESKE